MKEVKSILIIAICIMIAAFGIYFQFFHKGEEISKEKPVSEEETRESQAEQKPAGQKPPEEDELEAQIFGDHENFSVYFAGMEEIQEDDTFLPLQAYADMVAVTTDFFENQTDLQIPEGNVELRLSEGMTYKSNNLTSFHCYFSDIITELEIEYVYDDMEMEYIDIHFVTKGEWNLAWKAQ